MASNANSLSEEIDQLLEQYLHLLDQYTKLREQLCTAQSSLQQHIARANFTADRGIRYGQDQYDDRMQATRVLEVDAAGKEINTVAAVGKQNSSHQENPVGEQDRETDKPTDDSDTSRKSKDPLRMFGILVPQALRLAQAESIRIIEQIIPQLVNVNKDMETVEIEIRRKRKHKSKVEAKSASSSEPQRIAVESTA